MNSIKTYCPNCMHNNSIVFDYIQGVKVCNNCGLVINDVIIDDRAGKMQPDDTLRVGSQNNELYTDRGFNLEGLNYRSNADQSDKTLHKGIQKLKEAACALNVSDDVLNCSLSVFKEAKDKLKTKIVRINSLVAATLFMASKKCKMPISIKRIEEYLCIKRKAMTKNIKLISELTSMECQGITQDYVKSLGNNLNLSFPIITVAHKIYQYSMQCGLLGGKNPFTIAGVSILSSCKVLHYDLSPKAIAMYAKVSVCTITRTFNFLMKHKDILLSSIGLL
jgi:transcription initiation factor TFIIB